MELRDYFAGQALMGMLATPEVRPMMTASMTKADRAEICYQHADAMMKEKENIVKRNVEREVERTGVRFEVTYNPMYYCEERISKSKNKK